MNTRHVLPLFQAVLFSSFALLAGLVHAQSADEAIRQRLEAEGVAITQVDALPQEVLVSYDQDPLAEKESELSVWLLIGRVAVENAPLVERVVIHVDSMGEPLHEVAVSGTDIRAFLGGQMDPTAFSDALIISDRRPPERALIENIGTLGFLDPELKVEGSELHIYFQQPEAGPLSERAEDWIQILVWVADKTAGLTRTILHEDSADGSKVDVSADMTDVLDYRSGDLSLSEFLEKVEFSGLPEAAVSEMLPPTPSSLLVPPTPTVAVEDQAAPVQTLPGSPTDPFELPTLPPLPQFDLPTQAPSPTVVLPTLPIPPGMTPLPLPPAAPDSLPTLAPLVPVVEPTLASPAEPVAPEPAAVAPPQMEIKPPPAVSAEVEVQPPPEPVAPVPEVVQPSPQPEPKPTTAPTEVGLSGYIAFPVFKEGAPRPTYDVYVARPDGSERRLLWEWGRQPNMRPDGRVALNGDGGGKDNLWTVNLDGSDPEEASTHAEDAHPCWSPDGGRIVFDSQFYTWADQRIWTIWFQNELKPGIEPIPVNVADRVIPGEQPIWMDSDWVVYKGCNFWEGGSRCGLYTSPAGGAATARQLTDHSDDLPKDSLGERIVYMSLADGNWEVYGINFDGSGKVNLTNNPTTDGLPTFSPDGSQIAFVSDRDGAWAIWAMNADGSNQRKLFDLGGIMGGDWPGESISWELAGSGPAAAQPAAAAPAVAQPVPEPQIPAPVQAPAQPQVQPQATTPAVAQPSSPQVAVGPGRLAFASNFQGDYEIYSVNPDGSDLVRLTQTAGDDWHPAWSPDGSRIAYQCAREGGFDLCVMNADGGDGNRMQPYLSGVTASAQRPSWGPDGRNVAVSLESTASPTGIEVVAVDGSGSHFLTNGRDPSWAPDGSRIAFMENGQIFSISPDGSGRTQLTNSSDICMYPTYSQNGVHIAYSVEGQGIHIMNADGSNDHIATPQSSWGLAWSPDGTQLAISSEGTLMIVNTAGGVVRNLMQGVQPSWSRAAGTGASAAISAAPALAQPQPAAPAPAQAQPQPQLAVPAAASLPGYIAYPVYKAGMSKPTYDIYVSRPDGSDRRLLWEWGRQPDIRRGDGRVVLNGDGQGKDNLWTVNLDGSDAKESSLHPEDSHPRWGPNGERLLFDSEFYLWNDQRQWTVWVQNSAGEGTDPVAVTVADRVVPGQSPIWLDNDWVVYAGCNFWEGGSRCGLYTCPSWGDARARQLTDQPDDRAGDFYGDRIAYMSRASGNWDVYMVNFDGGGKVNLTNHPANDGLPAFSPDGSKIAFLSDREGVWAIWVMNADGSNPQKLFDIGGTMGEDWTTERISWGAAGPEPVAPAPAQSQAAAPEPSSGQPSWGPMVFCESVDDNNNPVSVGQSFPYGIQKICVHWPYAGVPVGTQITTRWYANENEVAHLTRTSALTQEADVMWAEVSLGTPLPAAVYRHTVEVNGQVVLSAECVIS